MYLLGCHFFVALYMSHDCFNVWIRARINSNEAKKRLGIVYDH